MAPGGIQKAGIVDVAHRAARLGRPDTSRMQAVCDLRVNDPDGPKRVPIAIALLTLDLSNSVRDDGQGYHFIVGARALHHG